MTDRIPTTTRRAILAGTASLPALALALPAGAETVVNGTDAVWPAYLEARAAVDAVYAAAAEADAALPEQFRLGNTPFVSVQHGTEEPRKFTSTSCWRASARRTQSSPLASAGRRRSPPATPTTTD